MIEGWTRRCPVCNEDRPLNDFWRGHRPCRRCHYARARQLAGLRALGLNPLFNPSNPWNPDKLSRLIGLYEEGLPHQEIAARFGTTKNAIIGKLHRLGYGGRLTSTFAERIQALHDKMDAVIEETKGVRMYLPQLTGKGIVEAKP